MCSIFCKHVVLLYIHRYYILHGKSKQTPEWSSIISGSNTLMLKEASVKNQLYCHNSSTLHLNMTARFCCGNYTNRTPGCVDDMLKVLHWESLETTKKNNRLSLLHKINTGHVDITTDQYLQRSDPRTQGAQRFRHARADHPPLYHSFFPATLRQWNRLPTSLSATTCPEAFRVGLRALTSALISS